MTTSSNRRTQNAAKVDPLADPRLWSRWIAWLFDLPPLWEYQTARLSEGETTGSRPPWVKFRDALAFHVPRLRTHLQQALEPGERGEPWFLDLRSDEPWPLAKLEAAVGWFERTLFPDLLELGKLANVLAATSPRMRTSTHQSAPPVPSEPGSDAPLAATSLETLGATTDRLIAVGTAFLNDLALLAERPGDHGQLQRVIVDGRVALGELLAGTQHAVRLMRRQAEALRGSVKEVTAAPIMERRSRNHRVTPLTADVWRGKRTWFARHVDLELDSSSGHHASPLIREEVDIVGGKIQVAGTASGRAIEAGQIAHAVQEIARQTRESTDRLHRESLLLPPGPGTRPLPSVPPTDDADEDAEEANASVTRTRLRITHALPREPQGVPNAPAPQDQTGNVEIAAKIRLDSPNAQRMAMALEKIQSRAPGVDDPDYAATHTDLDLGGTAAAAMARGDEPPPPPAGPGPRARRGIDPPPPPARGPKPLVVSEEWGKPIAYSDTHDGLPDANRLRDQPHDASRESGPHDPPPPAGPGRLAGSQE